MDSQINPEGKLLTQLKNIIISILIIFLIGFGIYREISYRNLKQDYIELKYNNIYKIDSLNKSINFKDLEIETLEQEITTLDSRVDSLLKIKTKIQRDTFTISTSVKGSAEQLKTNLQWKD